MPYITVPMSPAYHQITLDELFNGDMTSFNATPITMNTTNTRTFYTTWVDDKFIQKCDFTKMFFSLENFVNNHAELYTKNRESLYDTFHIPKKSGGLREINAPKPELMTALRELKTIFETQFFALYHTSAFAYVPGRCTIDSVKRHQKNDSHWFLKTDSLTSLAAQRSSS